MKGLICVLLLVNTLFAVGSIKVGVLHSLSGSMVDSEAPVVDATLLAIEEINARGGIIGKKLQPVVIDGASDDLEFAKGAKKLILEDKVSVVFGCWTSASRKAVKPIFEEHDSLLFYPVQYEGLESSNNIVYTGAAPNQQIIPGASWACQTVGQRIFLVGSDYVFPRRANEIIQKVIYAFGGEILGEEYIPLGSQNVDEVVQKIVEAKPELILNTLNGISNRYFFEALRKAGVDSFQTPTMSFSIGATELIAYNLIDKCKGDFTAWNYYESIESKQNKRFIQAFKKRYGKERHISDPMEAAYFGVYLWAQAVEESGVAKSEIIKNTIKTQVLLAPEGMVYVDPDTNHVWKTVRIGQLDANGVFNIIWSSEKSIKPFPYPLIWGLKS